MFPFFTIPIVLSFVFAVIIGSNSATIHGSESTYRFIYLMIAKLMQFVYLRVLLFVFKKDRKLDLKSNLVLLFTSIASIGGMTILMHILLSYNIPKMHGFLAALAAILVVSNIAVYYLIYQTQNLLKNKYEVKLLKEKMEFDRRRYEESEAVWEHIRKVRHDMKNHFSVIAGYSKNNDCKAVNSYIDSILPSVESMGNFIQSENSVLDYLINSKLSVLKNTEVVVSGIVDSFKDIEDIDLACVIGNVLDNAVEAQEHVQGTKRIELSFTTVNDTRMIVCKNTVAKSVLESNKELNSTKSNPEDHGLGHKIVQSVLAKYEGWADYFEIDDMFGVQIMIPLPKERRQADF
jgi:sensor histidine kinase regulating citrate/malate metabolism